MDDRDLHLASTPTPLLIIFSGLPATGKTTIARTLAGQLGATYLRIDSIEQAIRDSWPPSQQIDDEGYRVAYAIAEDNLRLGRTVISDSVNALEISRGAWLDVARRAQVSAVEVEIICSDQQQHRRRVESRSVDIAGLKLPTWEAVRSREYDPWLRDHIVIDTANRAAADSVEHLRQALERKLTQDSR